MELYLATHSCIFLMDYLSPFFKTWA